VNVCQTISRDELEDSYGILLPQPTEDEDTARCPTAYELLTAYASNDLLLLLCIDFNAVFSVLCECNEVSHAVDHIETYLFYGHVLLGCTHMVYKCEMLSVVIIECSGIVCTCNTPDNIVR